MASGIFYQTHFFPLLKLKGEVNEIFMTLKAKNGSRIPVMVNAKASGNDSQLIYIGLFSTVWERQKYEQALLDATKAQKKAIEENAVLIQLKKELEINQQRLDRNLAMVNDRNAEYLQIGKVLTHDMQEPIRKIYFYLETLKNNLSSHQIQENNSSIVILNKSVTRLQRLTNALLDFVSTASKEEPYAQLAAAPLLQQAAKEVQEELGIDDLLLEVSPIPEFWGKASQIRRVFFEIIKNAVIHNDPTLPLVMKVNAVIIAENAYRVTAGKYQFTDHVQIELRDDGVGFDSQYEQYVFGLLNKLRVNPDALGIGLTLCRQIVAAHQGQIKIQSTPLMGSKVTITIPIKPPQDFYNEN